MSNRAKNYLWWQTDAASWKGEIEKRKRSMPIYCLQEIVLADYLCRCAPARVLEFGCGYGRHLKYLRSIPGLEVYGYDQSKPMIEHVDWETPEWVAEHLRVGEPLGRLPFNDNEFDVVYTVSVLIHVRPRDLDGILSELIRVARWQVLHIENNATERTFMTSSAHSGCWAHDLTSAYGKLAVSAQLLPKCFDLEDIYRVLLDPLRVPPAVDQGFARRLLELDQAVSGEVRRLQEVESRAKRRTNALEEQVGGLCARVAEVRADHEALAKKQAAAVARAREAETKQSEALERARAAEAKQAAAVARAREAETKQSEALERAREAEENHSKALARAKSAERRCRGAVDADQREAEKKDRELTQVVTLERTSSSVRSARLTAEPPAKSDPALNHR